MSAVKVTRFVASTEPHNYSGRDVSAGETLYTFSQPVYGAVDWHNGIALSEADDEYPFFEFPRDAIEVTQ